MTANRGRLVASIALLALPLLLAACGGTASPAPSDPSSSEPAPATSADPTTAAPADVATPAEWASLVAEQDVDITDMHNTSDHGARAARYRPGTPTP